MTVYHGEDEEKDVVLLVDGLNRVTSAGKDFAKAALIAAEPEELRRVARVPVASPRFR